jgi:hypothetical protein
MKLSRRSSTVLDTAIREHPEDSNLLILKVKFGYGSGSHYSCPAPTRNLTDLMEQLVKTCGFRVIASEPILSVEDPKRTAWLLAWERKPIALLTQAGSALIKV